MNKKGRAWAFIIYPDSMPSNYEEIITNIGLPLAMSPLHDSDINPDGSPKKPHYHCIVYYENTTTYNKILSRVTRHPLGGVIVPPTRSSALARLKARAL